MAVLASISLVGMGSWVLILIALYFLEPEIDPCEYLRLTEKPNCEYRDGVVTPKARSDKFHSVVQFALLMLLRAQGVRPLPELTVRISPTTFLVPDVSVATDRRAFVFDNKIHQKRWMPTMRFLAAFESACLSLIVVTSLSAQRMANTYPNLQSFVDSCPQNDPYYPVIRQDFKILRDHTAVGAIQCTEPYSTMPASQVTEELTVIQALRFAYYMDMGRSQYLPWTPLRLYDWFKSRVGGFNIDTTLDPGSVAASCCALIQGRQYIVESVISNDLNRKYRQTPDGLAAQVALIAHETRHSEGNNYGHVNCCGIPGGCDQSYDETNLSAYGIQYYLAKQWLSGAINLGYSCDSQGRAQLASAFQQLANVYPSRFCDAKPPVLSPAAAPGGPCVAACSFRLGDSAPQIPSPGGLYAPRITASGQSCGWTAASADEWISPTSAMNFAGSGSATYGVDLNQGGSSRTGTIIGAGVKVQVNQADCQACAPIPTISAVVSTAPFITEIASGSWVTIYGSNLAEATREWQSEDFNGSKMPLTLDGVSVTINGQPSSIYYISPTQINVQSPDDGSTGAVAVRLANPRGTAKGTASLQKYAPGFFAFGGKYVAAVHADGTYVGPEGLFGESLGTQPARPGEVVTMYGTGFGPTNPPTGAGVILGGAPPLAFPEKLEIRMGGLLATVQYAGLTGAGLYQFNVVVPNLPDGDSKVVAYITNGASSGTVQAVSAQTIFIAIRHP